MKNQQQQKIRTSNRGAFALLALLWIVAALLVDPRGDFPLNDDWSFGRAVKNLLETGNMQMSDGWASMTLAAQVYWGALFCLPFGFSFEALRLSTWLLALCGGWATYALSRELLHNKTLSLLFAVVLLFGPVYFNASFTFLTDIPFVALCAIAALYLVRALDGSNSKDYWLMILVIVLATMIRQLAALMAIAFAFGYWLRNSGQHRSWSRALLPAALCAILILLHQLLLFPNFGFPDLRSPQLRHLAGALLHSPLGTLAQMSDDAVIMLTYIGLFLLPLLPIAIRHAVRHASTLRTVAGLAALGAIGFFLIQSDQLMPLGRNILRDGGLGPLTLRDSYVLRIERFATAPPRVWMAVTWLSALSAALYFGEVVVQCTTALKNWRRPAARDAAVIVFCVSGIAYFVLMSASAYFDRYLLFFLAGVPLLFAGYESRSESPSTVVAALTVALTLLFVLFSVCATRDYMSWQRARWTLLNELQGQGVSADAIDGGFEFNGYFNYAADYARSDAKSWWWVHDDRYLISFGEMSGYRVKNAVAFDTILPGCSKTVCLLERSP